MHSYVMKSLVTCALGAALMAGCASSPSSKTAYSQTNMQMGKVVSVERAALIDQTTATTSSGTSVVGTRATSEPTIITVQFNDGSQGRYSLERPTTNFAVGEPVRVITDPDRVTITR